MFITVTEKNCNYTVKTSLDYITCIRECEDTICFFHNDELVDIALKDDGLIFLKILA